MARLDFIAGDRQVVGGINSDILSETVSIFKVSMFSIMCVIYKCIYMDMNEW